MASSQETKRTTNPTWSRRTERFQKDIPPIPQNDINRLPDCVERSLQFFYGVWEELVVVKKKKRQLVTLGENNFVQEKECNDILLGSLVNNIYLETIHGDTERSFVQKLW